MRTPLIIVNFKSYKASFGERGIKLAGFCDAVSKEHGVSIVIAPQYTDLKEVKSRFDIPIFAQHIDPIEKAGAYTGHIIAENLKEIGIAGSLINHSERRLKLEDVAECVEILKSLKLVSVCCAVTLEEVERFAKFDPDFIAIEPPELIGGGISVSASKPEAITQCVGVVRKTNPKVKVLCGAGITTGQDVKRALELGAQGVLVASGIVKAADPRKVLEELVRSI